MTKNETLKLALEALISITDAIYVNSKQEADAVYKANDVIAAINEALAQPEQTNIERHEANIQKFLDAPQPEQEPVAWRFTGIAGLKRYMTQKHYDAQTPEIKKWYEPFKCKNCTTPPPPEQEPVALPDWFNHAFPSGTLEAVGFHMPTPRAFAEEMYKRWKRRFEELSTPPQRKPLTDEQIKTVIQSIDPDEQYMPSALRQFARAIEAAHGIKE